MTTFLLEENEWKAADFQLSLWELVVVPLVFSEPLESVIVVVRLVSQRHTKLLQSGLYPSYCWLLIKNTSGRTDHCGIPCYLRTALANHFIIFDSLCGLHLRFLYYLFNKWFGCSMFCNAKLVWWICYRLCLKSVKTNFNYSELEITNEF